MTCPDANLDHCVLCHQRAPGDVDAMIDAGWFPYYWDGDVERDGPVCPNCVATRLREDKHGEFELIPPEERPSGS